MNHMQGTPQDTPPNTQATRTRINKTPPAFWDKKWHPTGLLLWPLSLLYRVATLWKRLFSGATYHCDIPVICVGNVVVGGAGKTPVVQALCKHLQQLGKKPHIVSRGYGGAFEGPLRVKPSLHTPAQVGDEPLLHARTFPTWVAKDRASGVKMAYENGADVIVLDDGLQNNSVHKTLSLCVIDGSYGLGNGLILPAGPLRESFRSAMRHSDAAILIGKDIHKIEERMPRKLPCLFADIRVDESAALRLKGKKLLAFSGIGRPSKFYDTLTRIGGKIKIRASFPDHHHYTEPELDALVEQSTQQSLQLATTSKDFIRIPEAYHPHIDVLPITVEFRNQQALTQLLSTMYKVQALFDSLATATDAAHA